MNPDHLRALEDRLIAAFTDESISADEYVAIAHEMVHARSDHLRAAIERIGIERPSDYALVMEEVGRMEAEEKLVERVARAIYDQPTTFDGDTIATHLALSQTIDASTASVDESREVVMGVCRDAARAAVALVKAVREVKG